MDVATTTISASDLINFSQGIAQLNLGYLAISVAILGGLGGVFVYFNVKPLKDSLDKQEREIESLKKDAQGLLVKSAEQSHKAIEGFKEEQNKSLTISFERQEQRLKLETTNQIQEIEKNISEKIETVSEEKDVKVREIVLSETSNKLATTEKELTSSITSVKEELIKENTSLKALIVGVKSALKEAEEDIKELKVYRFSKEGKMGAIIYSIELLKDAIDDFLKNKEMHTSIPPKEFETTFSWKVKMRLEELLNEAGKYVVEKGYGPQIEKQLARLSGMGTFDELVAKIKLKLTE